MNWLVRGLSSSIGKKILMSVTGLLLCIFLVVHLAGNLFLFAGPEAYNNYAHKLHEQEALVKTVEAVLILLFGGHIILAVVTSRQNQARREVTYAEKESKIGNKVLAAAPSSWMLLSGGLVLAFLILHLVDFTWELRPDVTYSGREPFEKAVAILSTPLSWSVYIVGCAILGVHLYHGFWSGFQSLGISHPKYTPLIQAVGVIFAVVIALGFISFPLWATAFTDSGL